MTERPLAIITGAGRGIGAAIAGRLATDGWDLALVDLCRDEPTLPYAMATHRELDAAANNCRTANPLAQVETIAADVRARQEMADAVRAVLSRHGRLDAVIAAAGAIAGGGPTWETDDATWRTMIDVNLTGVFNLAAAGVPALLAQPQPRHGRFVAIASAAASVGLAQLGAYSAAKHGVVGLVRSMARELAGSGITCNAVSPGSTATAMLDATAAIYGIADPADFAQHSDVGRILDPDEIANAVAFVCRPDAGALTGLVLPVDGGFSG